MGYKIVFELLVSEIEKTMIETHKINVSEIMITALQAELKAKHDIMIATRFHDEREKIKELSRENNCLRERLERKSSPVITIGVRKPFR